MSRLSTVNWVEDARIASSINRKSKGIQADTSRNPILRCFKDLVASSSTADQAESGTRAIKLITRFRVCDLSRNGGRVDNLS